MPALLPLVTIGATGSPGGHIASASLRARSSTPPGSTVRKTKTLPRARFSPPEDLAQETTNTHLTLCTTVATEIELDERRVALEAHAARLQRQFADLKDTIADEVHLAVTAATALAIAATKRRELASAVIAARELEQRLEARNSALERREVALAAQHDALSDALCDARDHFEAELIDRGGSSENEVALREAQRVNHALELELAALNNTLRALERGDAAGRQRAAASVAIGATALPRFRPRQLRDGLRSEHVQRTDALRSLFGHYAAAHPDQVGESVLALAGFRRLAAACGMCAPDRIAISLRKSLRGAPPVSRAPPAAALSQAEAARLRLALPPASDAAPQRAPSPRQDVGADIAVLEHLFLTASTARGGAGRAYGIGFARFLDVVAAVAAEVGTSAAQLERFMVQHFARRKAAVRRAHEHLMRLKPGARLEAGASARDP